MLNHSSTYRIGRSALLILLGAWLALAVEPATGQRVTQDWKLHDAGQVLHIITNSGALNKEGYPSYSRLLNTEYPPRSFQEHLGRTGWYIGALNEDGDTLVSNTRSFGVPDEFRGFSSEPWDTIWVVQRGDTADIPYFDEPYAPLSDQDFVTRYNDYNEASLQVSNHTPLGLDVIQTSHAWASPPLDEVIVINYAVVAKQGPLKDVYITQFVDGNVGYRTGSGFAFANDDFVRYYDEYDMVATFDAPGGEDGGEYTPFGMMTLAPEEEAEVPLTWTFQWDNCCSGLAPSQDGPRYAQMLTGDVDADQVLPSQTHHLLSVGPFQLSAGDTLRFSLALIMGPDERGLIDNARVVKSLAERDFRVPGPPPNPNVAVRSESGRVVLDWTGSQDAVERYEDPNRSDEAEQPFEGYRVYKSTQSQSGPWTLLGEYDLVGNAFGPNTGVRRELSDEGLMDYVAYYYTVTAYSKPDTAALNWPSQETSLRSNAVRVVPGPAPPGTVGQVKVVPNPYRGDIRYQDFEPPWERPDESRERWLEQDRRIRFTHLPPRCEIRIYTVSGTLVQTLQHSSASEGYETWNLTSSVGQAVGSGIYLFTVENLETGEQQVGKFVIIK